MRLMVKKEEASLRTLPPRGTAERPEVRTLIHT